MTWQWVVLIVAVLALFCFYNWCASWRYVAGIRAAQVIAEQGHDKVTVKELRER